MKLGSKIKQAGVPPFAILLITFTLLVLMHNFTTPVFEAPDEVWHYNYVRWLAEGHGLPSLTNDESGANQEAAQPPFYYAAGALISIPFPDDDLQDLFWSNPGFGYQAPGTSPDNKNMLIHTDRESFPWKGAVAAVHAARFTSLFFGIWTLAAAWLLGCEVFTNRKGALILASVIAFHPQFIFMCSVTSNDSATAALCTTALYTIVRATRRRTILRDIVMCGLAIGTATLTKTSAILLIPLSGTALIFDAAQRKMPFAELLKRLVILSGCILLVGGWWYGRNALLYDDPMGFSSHTDTPWGRKTPISYVQLLPEIPALVKSFWAAYGWGHVTWSDAVPLVLTISSGLFAVYGLVGLFKNQPQRHVISGENRGRHILLAGSWLGLVTLALLSWMRQVEAPHGRLLFPALSAWALIVANGLVKAEAKGGMSRWLAHVFLGLVAALSALAPGARILPAFAPPRLRKIPTQAESADLPTLVIDDRVKAVVTHIDEGYYAPGDAVRVRICWEALQRLDTDYTVFVHLLGPENMRTAERHTYPGLGRYPTTLWEMGKTFCDTYRLQIETWAPTPVLYNVEAGLFDAETGARLPTTNALGQSVEPPIVGAVAIYEEDTQSSPGAVLDVIFGDQIQLVGVNIPRRGAPGEALRVILHWKVLAKPERGLKMFVHLWQPGSAEPFAQDDGIPNQGWFPTDVWEKGIYVTDPHDIRLPADLPPGIYPLWAGIYRAADGTRLRAVGPEGPITDDLVQLGEIQIQ